MKLLIKIGVLALSFYGVFICYSQDHKQEYIVEFQTTFASKNTVPFWLSANTYGRIQKEPSNVLYTAITGGFSNAASNLHYSYKIGTTFYNADKNTIFIDELYGDLKYKNWGLTVGVKHDNQVLQGLSSSNGNITANSSTTFMIFLILFSRHAQTWGTT